MRRGENRELRRLTAAPPVRKTRSPLPMTFRSHAHENVRLSEGTLPIENGASIAREVPRFRLTVIEDARDESAARVAESSADGLSVGSDAMNGLVLDDATVSRFHCEIRIGATGARLVDLESRNGTFVNGYRARDVDLIPGALVRVGRTVLRFDPVTEKTNVPCSAQSRFGSLVGASLAMRATFALLEKVAPTSATVLLEGETGCGKGQAAESIHRASTRRHGPLVIVDCGAMPAALLESELFGHEKGAFTGAHARRIGAFEAASGGTIFLDEVGELPAELQPKLLRVLENRHIRRLGSHAYAPVDVRVLAATNRDLRADVNATRFRADLFFRLAVVRIALPSLRERPDDVRLLAEHILSALAATPEQTHALLTPPFLEEIERAPWPGNVRELRNYLERALIFPDATPEGAAASPAGAGGGELPYAEAKDLALARFERTYVTELLQKH